MKILLRSWHSSSEPSESDPEFLGYLQQRRLFNITCATKGVATVVETYVSRANSMAILCKTAKGAVTLIDWGDVTEIEEIAPPVVVTKLVVRNLKDPEYDKVRQHLLDSHGLTLSDVPDDVEQAIATHAAAHMTQGLGHRHRAPEGPTLILSALSVAERAAALNAEYENALECDSCGYVRLPDEDGRSFFNYKMEDGHELMHCEECKDEEEFTYLPTS